MNNERLKIDSSGDEQIEQGNNNKSKLHGLSPRVNYTDRANVACRRG
jgi:hypothetical protein